MKTCGECTLCCELLPIGEINKSPNTLCKDCTLNKGCNIYNNRPESCKNFNCSYLTSDDMGESLKPNICNIIFEVVTDTIHLGLVHYNHLDAWKNKQVQDYVQTLNDKGISVIISSFTNSHKMVKPAVGITAEEVMNLAMDVYNKEKIKL